MLNVFGTIFARDKMIMIFIIDKILILILIIILNKLPHFDFDFHSQQQIWAKKDGQKMTDNQKSFGVRGLFKIVGPIYYIELVSRAFLVWILHHIHQVLNTLSFKDRSGSSLSFIKHLPPFSRPIRFFSFGPF